MTKIDYKREKYFKKANKNKDKQLTLKKIMQKNLTHIDAYINKIN